MPLREQAIAFHHLGDRPLQGAGGLFRVGDHGDEQVGDAIIDTQLHHFRIHHDQTHLVRGGAVEQGDDEGVGADALTGAGGAGDKQVGQLGDVPYHAFARDVLAHSKGNLGGVGAELV